MLPSQYKSLPLVGERTEQQPPTMRQVHAVAVFRLEMLKSFPSPICLKSSLLFMSVLLKQVLFCVQIFLIYVDDTVR